jgi:hypothetical protein
LDAVTAVGIPAESAMGGAKDEDSERTFPRNFRSAKTAE